MTKETFYTADLHIGHKNIIKYCNRPFEDVDDMNEQLIKRWNRKVSKGDDVYIIGDVAVCDAREAAKHLSCLNGNKLLVAGNHDRRNIKNKEFKKQFGWIKDLYIAKIPDTDAHDDLQRIFMFHYACRTWDKCGWESWHLYGHSHGNLPERDDMLSLDVGVDSHNYEPLSYNEVKQIMLAKNRLDTARFGY